MKALLLTLLILLSAFSSYSQTTNPKPGLSRPAGTVCVSASQAAIIAQALRRFEKLKPAYLEKQLAYTGLVLVSRKDSATLAGNKRIIDWYKGAYSEEQLLRQDANKKLEISQGKARRRGWLVAIETAAIALIGYALITK
jgi:hypothetical protein